MLRSRLLQQKQDAYDEAYNAQRQSQVGSGDRSEKIRTYNFPQDRVTAHRIGLTLRNLQGVRDGDLDRVVEPLILPSIPIRSQMPFAISCSPSMSMS